MIKAILLLLLSLSLDTAAQERPSLEGRPGLAEFHAYLGETFRVYGGRGARWVERLTLQRIEDHSRPGEPVEQFRLVFHGSAASTLEKDSYFAEHPEAGRFRLFLTPGPGNGSIREIHVDMVLLTTGGGS